MACVASTVRIITCNKKNKKKSKRREETRSFRRCLWAKCFEHLQHSRWGLAGLQESNHSRLHPDPSAKLDRLERHT